VRRLGCPVDARHGNGIGEEVFGELACDGSGGGLFDFGEIEVQEVVEEVEDFFAGGEVGSVHHSDGGIRSVAHLGLIRSRAILEGIPARRRLKELNSDDNNPSIVSVY